MELQSKYEFHADKQRRHSMGVKLLIADDEEIIRNGIAKYVQLHTDRFDKIFLASNGQETIDIIFHR